MKRAKVNMLFRTAGLLISLCIAAFLINSGKFTYLLFIGPLIVYQLYLIYKNQLMVYKEVEQFAQALYYRDFSRNFNSNARSELSPLYRNFNEISRLFQQVSREKETQYQYLQKILELVNTGILSYQSDNGEVIWMNESLKTMLDRPYLKNILSVAKRDESLHREIVSLKPGESKIVTLFTNR